jgi:hypothetical protein
MKLRAILLVLAVTICSASAARRIEIHAAPVAASQVIDATHLRRHAKNEVEVSVVQQARGSGQLMFHLNGLAVAKLAYADWIQLYLPPGRYRLGVVPAHNFGRAGLWEMNVDLSGSKPRIYKIFQSSGFTSSGGNAVYEIAPY